jgi:Na+-translocating ferredoxin:NAD+ oxidoreductase subunit B
MSMGMAVLTMGGLGGLFATALAIADYKLRVEEDPRLPQLIDALPGANCGGCGLAGCGDFATKLIDGETAIDGCPAGGADTLANLADILGVVANASEPMVARVLCQGGLEEALQAATYFGPQSCATRAQAGGGGKACTYGCLNGGDCVEVCSFHALVLDENGLPQLIEELCTGCGACVKACPRDLIELHPISRNLFVLCKNQDDPKRAKRVCSTACIGCRACTKKSEGSITMEGTLAVVQHEALDLSKVDCGICRTGALTLLPSTEAKSECA